MRKSVGLFLLGALIVGCGGSASEDSEPAEFAPPGVSGKADSAGGGQGTLKRLQLDHGAFPATGNRPNVIVYFPPGFDPTPPIDVIVYIHGFYNCIDNVIRAQNGTCGSRQTRNAYNLLAQLDASGKNAMLVLPEVRYEYADSSPGTLGNQGGFRALMEDVLAQTTDTLGERTTDDLGQIAVYSHSGGYVAAAGIAQRGGLPVTEIALLDSLYGYQGDFDAWIRAWPQGFGSPRNRRFSIVYTGFAGTLGNSQTLATKEKPLFSQGVELDDRTTKTLPDSAFDAGLLFKRSGLSHDGVPRYYFGKLVATSDLRSLN